MALFKLALFALLSGLTPLVVLAGLSRFDRLSPALRRTWYAVTSLLTLYFVEHFAHIVAANFVHPPFWDFHVFWLYGRVAVLLHNVYDPANFRLVEGHTLRPELAIGFPYPPPTIFLLLPLGLFSTSSRVALAVWYAMHFVALALIVLLLWRRFFASFGKAGLLAALALTLSFGPLLRTLAWTQTLVILTLFTLLFFADPNALRRGLWLAIAIILKPFTAILLLEPIARGRWRTLVATIVALAISTVAAIPIIGMSGFATYMRRNPAGHYPGSEFWESPNASLFAVLLRLTHEHAASYQFSQQYLFLVLVAAVVVATLVLCILVEGSNRELRLSLMLATGLIVYPATSVAYPMVLLVPFAMLWQQRTALPGGTPLLVGFVSLDYLLLASENGSVAFAGLLLCWLSFAALMLAMRRVPVHAPRRA
ncbi:MAG TPA: glycosyltransferase family 87 protein [Candidatus Dormibacteraeota bacterium]|nr:glycosyltransferase family 87 protein [Candidatus Dormibacteraeota bacterium]